MKTRTIYLRSLFVAFATIFTLSLFGQAPTDFKPHGTDSGDNIVATENTDSVTVGGTLDYFVMPDNSISPSYDYSVDPVANLNSTFDWSGTTGTPTFTDNSAIGPIGAASNYVSFEWAATGAQTVSVAEQSITASCADATPVTIPVAVIAAPTGEFSSASSNICSTDPTAESFDFPVTATTAMTNGQMTIHVTIGHPVSGTLFDSDVALDVDGTTVVTFAGFDDYGDWTATITEVKDRISTKSGIAVASGIGAQSTYVYTINATPNTGEIYHLPNK